MKKYLVPLLLSFLAVNCSCATLMGAKRVQEDRDRKIVSSTVLISDMSGDTYGSGTLIMYGKGVYVLTAHHVVKKELNGEIPYVRVFAACPEIRSYIASVKSYDEPGDVAVLLLLSDKIDLSGCAVRVAKTMPKVGNRVIVSGFPGGPSRGGIVPSLTSGIISRYAKKDGKDIYYSDAQIYKGASGGGMFNEDGEVVGVVIGFEFDPVLNQVVPGSFMFSALTNIRELLEK